MLILMNVTLIIKSYVNKDEVPSIGKMFPMIVLTDSMYPQIQSGDLIICNKVNTSDIKEGDVISFFDPSGNGTSVVTHRVVGITEEDGVLAFKTKGDANNAEDQKAVKAEKVVGVYSFRIPKAGRVAMFMQTTAGLIVCVILPLILFVGYDVIRRRRFEKANQADTAALLAELEELKAQKAAKEKNNE
ncbi:signal peptidase I [uncultured Ruminococcus sp.]|uniref:signal peptidase I n=1 Tax=uncultured Ruminococcus sp. TaxID=165186 RepID=UPI0025F7E8C5|nr:signal peptidase I [uncultured Ruminococcus sp.]